MDPVSAIGLLASISTLINVSKGALDLLRSFKDAEQDLAELARDLNHFDEALRGFDRVFRSRQTKHNVSGDVLREAIDDSNATLAEVEKRLTQVYKSESSTLRRARFVRYKSRFAALGARIQNKSSQLHGFISLVHVETFLATCNQNPQLLEACTAVVDQIGSVFVPQDDGTPLPVFSNAQTQSSCSSEAVSFSGAESAVDSSSSQKASVASSTSSDNSIPLSQDHPRRSVNSQTSDLGSAVSAKSGPLVIRRACKHNCYCKCHEQGATEPKNGFSARIFRQGSHPKIECSDPTCKGAAMQNSIPISSFKRAMLHLMSSNSIKIRYHMNTYRMVPEGSNAMRYVKHGNLGKLKAAIQSGEATLWDTATDGWSLLHTAAYARQLETVQYLLELGADPAVSDLGTRKPVDLAFLKSIGADATQVEKDIVEVFSREDDYIDDYEFTPIHNAVLDLYEHSDPERPTLQQIIDFVDNANNAPPDTNWAAWKTEYHCRSPLYVSIIERYRVSAAETYSTNRVIHNLTDQKDRKFHWTPLHWASATGQAQKMKILVQNGADPFIQSNLSFSIIHAAVESNACESLGYALELSKHHPDQLSINQANIWGETPLIMAAQGCRVSCVKLLLDAGADRNIRQENQQVALHYAGLSDRAELRRETLGLLCNQNGTELIIDAQDEDGRPPIFDFLDDTECLKIFIKHDARLDLSDNAGNSLFHQACMQGEVDSLETLQRLSGNAKDIVRNKNLAGNTALIEALRHTNVGCAMVLLTLQDVGDMVGQDAWAAVHYAAKLGDTGLLQAVVKHPNFVRGMKTRDGKTARVVATEAGNWRGETKQLLNTYNAVV